MNGRLVFVLLTSFAAAVLLGAAQPGQTENLLERYEPGDASFRSIEVDGDVIYFKQRMVGEAIVEKDMALYRFDRVSGELLDRKGYRRTDVPNRLPAEMITRAQAETLAEGEALFTRLYIISPDSDVFPIDPTPTNPWNCCRRGCSTTRWPSCSIRKTRNTAIRSPISTPGWPTPG